MSNKKKPKVKEWTIEELRHEAGQWIYTLGKNDVFVFLDWLEACQGSNFAEEE